MITTVNGMKLFPEKGGEKTSSEYGEGGGKTTTKFVGRSKLYTQNQNDATNLKRI